MVTVEKHGIILSPTDREFENNGVLNPGIYQDGDIVHILYRAVENGNLSTIGYAKTEGPFKIVERHEQPLITRDFDYEKHGVEDARIVKIEDTYYITYTAYDGINAMGALATSKDLIHFEKHGIITPQINYQEYESIATEMFNLNKTDALTLYDFVFDKPYTHLDFDTVNNTIYKNFNLLKFAKQ